jgi:hypothetical protein
MRLFWELDRSSIELRLPPKIGAKIDQLRKYGVRFNWGYTGFDRRIMLIKLLIQVVL